MTKRWSWGGVDLIHGDSREIIPEIDEQFDLAVLDPPWPNASIELAGSDDPCGLTESIANLLIGKAARIALMLGSDSDPRFLRCIHDHWKFLRVCWLRFARPNYKGRHLNGSEVAYLFGPAPAAPKHGFVGHLLPGESPTDGEVTSTSSSKRFHGHPCPRRPSHLRWLLRWFGGGSVIDPFAGGGTTLLAARELGIRAVGIECEERYCEAIAGRFSADPLLFTEKHGPS